MKRELPELKGLEPAENQDELPGLLQKVGKSVEAFFRDFANTTSIEEIIRGQLYSRAGMREIRTRRFFYLALARPNQRGPGLEEYRTDKKGRRIDPVVEGAGFTTKGFTSHPVFFHPSERSGSAFRYLGRETLKGRETAVIAFAQRPQKARSVGQFEIGSAFVLTMVQGVAWVDPATFQVVRMRTDLLAPRPDIGLERLTTEVRFGQVNFKGTSTSVWLPLEVVVTVKWRDRTFRNRHRYSNFRLFKVETEEKRGEEDSRKKRKSKAKSKRQMAKVKSKYRFVCGLRAEG